MSVLVLGGSGFIGAEALAGFRRHTEAVGTFRTNPAAAPSQEFNFPDGDLSAASRHDLIVICTASAREVGSAADLPRWRSDFSRLIDSAPEARVVLLSTDAVLGDGGPHPLRGRPEPGTLYGRASLAAEEIVLRRPDSAVIRTSYVFGIGCRGPDRRLMEMQRTAREGGTIRAAVDVYRNPTEVGYLVAELVRISLDPEARGIHHVAGQRMSLHEHFSRLAEALGQPPESVRPSRGSELGVAELDTSLVTEGDGAAAAERYELWLHKLAGWHRGVGASPVSRPHLVLHDKLSAEEAAAWPGCNKEVLWGWKRDRGALSRTVFLEARLALDNGRLHGEEVFFYYRTRVAPSDSERIRRQLETAAGRLRSLGVGATVRCRRQRGMTVTELELGSRTPRSEELLTRLLRRRPRRAIREPVLPPPRTVMDLGSLLPADLYVGSGVAYEAGLPTLCDMHERFGVDQENGLEFAFGPEDHLPRRLAADPAAVMTSFFDVHVGALSASPTPAMRTIAELASAGQFPAVYTDNVDNMLAKVGVEFARVRGSGVLNERYAVEPRTRRLIVVGVAADRRQLVQQYRSAGAEIVVVNPVLRVSPKVRHLDYIRPGDPFFRTTAHDFFDVAASESASEQVAA